MQPEPKRGLHKSIEVLAPKTDTPNGPCAVCGNEFKFEIPVSVLIAGFVKVCPRCTETETRHRIDEAVRDCAIRVKGETEWARICPEAFRETIQSRLPCPDAMAACLRWKFGPRGLLMLGRTGLGKSRVAWLILRRESEAGRTIGVVDSTQLAVSVPAMYGESCEAVEAWFRRAASRQVLLLDDPFKAKLTDRIEELLFNLIDKRYQECLPVILTTNDTGESITKRLSPDRAAPMARRLREGCEPVAFVTK